METNRLKPYKRYSSIRRFKKANGFHKIGNWSVWDEIEAQRDYNREIADCHYSESEYLKRRYYETL